MFEVFVFVLTFGTLLALVVAARGPSTYYTPRREDHDDEGSGRVAHQDRRAG